MPRRLITVSEVWQNLKERLFHEDIDCDPPSQRRFFVSNLVRRTLAHVVGKGPRGSVQIEATSSGELKVAVTATILENMSVTEHTATDDDAISVVFPEIISSIDLIVEDQNALVRYTVDDVTWQGWFTLKVGEAFKRDITMHTLEIKNAGAGVNHSARIWGYY